MVGSYLIKFESKVDNLLDPCIYVGIQSNCIEHIEPRL